MIASRKALIIVAAFVLMAIGMPWGGNVPAAFAQISVTAADPPTGEQGTLNLSVIIKGKGFKNGAKANWYKTGTTDPSGVNVKSTQYVSSTQLVATIDIADTAALAAFDIQVANTDGRTGKGTELFSVTAKKIDPCTLPDPVVTPSSRISYFPGLTGYLDGNFGGGAGRVIGARGLMVGLMDGKSPVALQPVGGRTAIVVAGKIHDSCISNSGSSWTVLRYLDDGSPDPSFGAGGVATAGLPAGSSFNYAVNSLAIQSDNKIVVVGHAPGYKSLSAPTVVRLNVDGSPDVGFGILGVVTLPGFGRTASGTLNAVAIQTDGRIVVGGSKGVQTYVVRLNPNGSIDSSFNAPPDLSPYLFSVRIQRVGSEDRVVAAGATIKAGGGHRATLWRFRASGAADTSFGDGGKVVISFHGDLNDSYDDWLTDLAIDSANRIVTAGYSYPPSSSSGEPRLALARVAESGDLDPDFGTGGTTIASAGFPHSIGSAIAIQASGHILVAGDSVSPDSWVPGLWRFNPDGTPDVMFGQDGWVPETITSGKRVASWAGIALQPDGQIVCVGHMDMSASPGVWYPILARFWQ
jgi:uncharacterized delta-60 repeat protein